MAWPFKRKKTSVDYPAEVQDYYKFDKPERTGTAWILALVTLVVTVLVALGLFFGGRWAYRKLAGKDQPGTTTQTAPPQVVQQPSSETGQPTTPPSSETPSAPGSGTDLPAPTTPTTNGPSSTSTPDVTPNTGPTLSATIPRTGPADTVAIFIAVSALATIGHRLYTAKRF